MRATGVFPQTKDDVTLWRPEDFIDGEYAQTKAQPWWRFARGWLITSIVLGIIIGIMGRGLIEQWNYTHALQGYARWIEHQSAAQTTCFQKASTDDERMTCARMAHQSITDKNRQFTTTIVPASMTNAASQMQQAFAALTTATCLSENATNVNNDCLQRLAPSLRKIAVLDAHDATRA